MPQQATTGPAPMEGIKRTNAVVVRGSGLDRMQGFLQNGTLMQWRLIGGGIVLPAEVLGTWPVIVGIEDREEG